MRSVLVSFALFFSSCATYAAPPTLHGIVRSGTTPIPSAVVTLYAAATTGYNQSSEVPTPASSAVTAADGSFSIPDHFCTPPPKPNSNHPPPPQTDRQLYLLATVDKTPITLISAIGRIPCSGTPILPTFVINEATTVASVYSLSGFLTDATSVSAPATANAEVGLANAFLTRLNLVDFSGTALPTTPSGNGRVPQGEINELANILNACVSSPATGNACSTLFANTADATAAASACKTPTDTVCALRNIVSHPEDNANHRLYNLYLGLNARTGVFQPTRPGLPTNPDWTLVISYNAPNLGPNGIVSAAYGAIDDLSNIWVSAGDGKSLTEFNPQGAVKYVAGDASNSQSFYGLNYPYGVAIDSVSNVWVANNYDLPTTANGFLSEFSDPTRGKSLSASLAGPFGYPSLTNAGAIAVDAGDQVWILTTDALLCNYPKPYAAQPCTTTPYNLTGQLEPGDRSSFGLTVAPDGSIWIGSRPNGKLVKIDPGHPNAPNPFTIPKLQGPRFLAADKNGDIWVSNILADASGAPSDGSLQAFTSAGKVAVSPVAATKNLTSLTPDPTSGGLCIPASITVDGNNTIWVANDTFGSQYCSNSSLSHFDSSGHPLTAQGQALAWGQFTEALSLQVDASGNIWVTSGASTFISEVVGAAAPTITPSSPATLGMRP